MQPDIAQNTLNPSNEKLNNKNSTSETEKTSITDKSKNSGSMPPGQMKEDATFGSKLTSFIKNTPSAVGGAICRFFKNAFITTIQVIIVIVFYPISLCYPDASICWM